VGAKAAALGTGEAGNASPWMVVRGIDASSSATFALQLDSRAERLLAFFSWHPGTEGPYTGPVEAVFVLVMITIQPHESSGFVFARRLFACK